MDFVHNMKAVKNAFFYLRYSINFDKEKNFVENVGNSVCENC